MALIGFGPFLPMMTAPHSAVMAAFMRFAMTRGARVLLGPFVVLAAWAAWQWLRLDRVTPFRVAAAGGVVVVAVASVWDLNWHQTHPLELGAAMNMMTLPPHQLILGGFGLGLIALVALVVGSPQSAPRGGLLRPSPSGAAGHLPMNGEEPAPPG